MSLLVISILVSLVTVEKVALKVSGDTETVSIDDQCLHVEAVHEEQDAIRTSIDLLQSWEELIKTEMAGTSKSNDSVAFVLDDIEIKINELNAAKALIDGRVVQCNAGLDGTTAGTRTNERTEMHRTGHGFREEAIDPEEEMIRTELARMNEVLINRTRSLEDENKKLGDKMTEMNSKVGDIERIIERANNRSKVLERENNELKSKFGDMEEELRDDLQSQSESAVSSLKTLVARSPLLSPPAPTSRSGNNETVSGGAVYTRWGAKTCSNTSQIIYSGFLGGGPSDRFNSPANDLCLPNNPKFLPKKQIRRPAEISGACFEDTRQCIMRVPCAVCETDKKRNAIMIPATFTCPTGWTKEYEGILSAGEPSQRSQSEYICIDKSVESGDKDAREGRTKRLFHVFAVCGTLPCSRYPEPYKPLPCVVCSG